MNDLNLPTLIFRHKKENLKKCSLRGLEGRTDLSFYTYPLELSSWENLDLTNYFMLSISGEALSPADASSGVLLIDGTWRYAKKMEAFVEQRGKIKKRSIPPGFVTAYPRCQYDCPDPAAGLASVEALYITYKLIGKNPDTLLDHYYWKKDFLEKNRARFSP